MGFFDDIILTSYKIAKEAGLLKSLSSFFRKKRKILLLGATGTGKSQFFDSIDDALSSRLTHTDRTAFPQKRRVIIKGIPFIFNDTPGQIANEATRKTAIKDAIRSDYEGIINIVCYGYHEADEADRSLALITENNELTVNQDFLIDRRKVELDLLSEWIPFLDDKDAKWILTIVTKADLWWPDQNEILNYYKSGKYSKLISNCKIPHSVIPYCSIIEPFFDTKTSGKFGDTTRKKLRQNLLESLIRITGEVRK
jgi:energy-coupling factor transporter ATP-binding protein EcfA2